VCVCVCVWSFKTPTLHTHEFVLMALSLLMGSICVYVGCLTKVKGKAVPLRSIEAHLGDRRYNSYSFLTSALEGGEWSASRPGRALTPGKEPPGTHCTGGWVGPRAGLDAEVRGKILCLCRGSNPGSTVRSQTLYRLS
jgi:hypothetical protein